VIPDIENLVRTKIEVNEEGLQELPLPFQFEEQHSSALDAEQIIEDRQVIQHQTFLDFSILLILGEQSLHIAKSSEIIMELFDVAAGRIVIALRSD
jgi:hypothetical protein